VTSPPTTAANSNINIRSLGLEAYEPVWRAMQALTDERDANTADEIWFVEHEPVFTLGLNANREHLLAPGDIPVIPIDRGGQVTYHGPGQLMIYLLLDLRRAGLGVRDLVTALEQSAIDLAADYAVQAASRATAPGVYVEGRKLASVGLRIRRGCCYHGMALNIDIDLQPFSRINTCGFRDLDVTDLRGVGIETGRAEVEARIEKHILQRLGLGDRKIVRSDQLARTIHE